MTSAHGYAPIATGRPVSAANTTAFERFFYAFRNPPPSINNEQNEKMEDVSHRDLHEQLHDLDRRVIKVEVQVDAISVSERSLTIKVEEIMETLAGIAGESRATKWILGLGLTATTIILTLVQFFVR